MVEISATPDKIDIYGKCQRPDLSTVGEWDGTDVSAPSKKSSAVKNLM